MTNKTESGTDVDFNCPRSHEKEEVPFHRPLLFPSSFPPPASPDNHPSRAAARGTAPPASVIRRVRDRGRATWVSRSSLFHLQLAPQL